MNTLTLVRTPIGWASSVISPLFRVVLTYDSRGLFTLCLAPALLGLHRAEVAQRRLG